MPTVKPLRADLARFLKSRNLTQKYNKQVKLIEKDFRHPSLHAEILEPKELRIYSFRVDKKYRAIFIFVDGEIEITDINLHYND